MSSPRIVIVGAIFGLLAAARWLRGAEVDLVIIDRHNHRLLRPLLSRVTTAVVSPAEIPPPVRGVVSDQANSKVMSADVDSIDLERSAINLTGIGGRHRGVGLDCIDRVKTQSGPSVTLLHNLVPLGHHSRLRGERLPADQGVERSGAAGFASNAIASTLGVPGMVARHYAPRIPFTVKLNRKGPLTYPDHACPPWVDSVSRAGRLVAVGVMASTYSGFDEVDRELVELSAAFGEAHRPGLFTVLWCHLCNDALEHNGVNYETAIDRTGQANHPGLTSQAQLIKRMQATCNRGYPAVDFDKTGPLAYAELATNHPFDLTRWQVANCHLGRIGRTNSGGGSAWIDDLVEVVRTAVFNKRAGGVGLIVGRAAFERPLPEGISPSTPSKTSISTPRPRGGLNSDDRRLYPDPMGPSEGRRYLAPPSNGTKTNPSLPRRLPLTTGRVGDPGSAYRTHQLDHAGTTPHTSVEQRR